jgi:hypothetical protein
MLTFASIHTPYNPIDKGAFGVSSQSCLYTSAGGLPWAMPLGDLGDESGSWQPSLV